ncbi:hypothetical protein [Methanosarcina horonobensis]|uniref:hypothetical protein n=1 Tax=Methanosarcina horonobensis TaxID=418008 RepID=UPI000A4A581B
MDSDTSESREELNSYPSVADSADGERGKALHAALEREEALKTIINNSQVVVFLWKNEEKRPAEFVSENVVNFGYTVEDFVSERVLYEEIIYPDDLKKKLKRDLKKEFGSELRISIWSTEFSQKPGRYVG